MKVLLTGASGLIGRQVAAELSDAGVEVHAVSRRRVDGLQDPVRWHCVDLLDRQAMQTCVAHVGATHLMHAAWCMEPGTVWQDPANLAWCGSTLHLVRRFAEAGGTRVLVVGTCAEYDWSGGYCDEWDTPRRPATLYGAAKDSTRVVLDSYARAAGISLAWVRLFNMYGPYEDTRRLVAAAVSALLQGRRFACTDGLQSRDFLYVRDVAAALVAVLRSAVEGPLNVGSGDEVTVRDVLEEIGCQTGRAGHVDYGALPRPAADPDTLLPHLGRLHRAVGWRPRYRLQEGIAETIAWWRSRMAAA